MKKILYLIFFLLAALNVTAQENIFILVDVSLSVKGSQLQDAKQLVKNVLIGKPVNSSIFYTVGNFQPKIIPAGSQILIMPLGERNTVMNYTPIIEEVNDESEIIRFINKQFPTTPKDNWTYISLAKARLAEIAKKHSIQNYKLIFVSDNISDDFGGRPNYSVYEQQLVDGYNTKNNPVIEKPGVRIKYVNNNAFSVFIQEIDVSGYYPPKQPVGTKTNQSIPTPLKIVLTTFKGGTKKKPVVLNENNLTISWFCRNAPKNARYKVSVSPINIQGEKRLNHKTTGKSYNVQNLSDGKWRISVYSANAADFNATSATTTIEINSGGSLWLLWLLLLALIGGGAYWFWNKTQEDKLMEIKSTQTSQENSFSNNPSTTDPNNNSDYF